MITFFDYSNKGATVSNVAVWFVIAIILAVIVAFYVLRSIGVFKLAKNNGEEGIAFMAWIPCVWIYLACRLVKEGNFFGKPIKKFALLICIVFSVTQILAFIYEFMVYLPLFSYFVCGGEIHLYFSSRNAVVANNFVEYWIEGSGIYVKSSTVVGGLDYTCGGLLNPTVLVKALNVIHYVTIFLDLVNTVLTLFMFFNLFRNYWPERYVVASIFSFLGLFSPFVFAIRNRKFVKYKDFLVNRYGNRPYYYTGWQSGNAEKPPQHPFEEFADKDEIDPGDPFDEFSDKENKDK